MISFVNKRFIPDAQWSISFFKRLSNRDLNTCILNASSDLERLQYLVFTVNGQEACHEQERILRAWLLLAAKDPGITPTFLEPALLKKRLEDTTGSLLHKIYCSLLIFRLLSKIESLSEIVSKINIQIQKWLSGTDLSNVKQPFHALFYAIIPLFISKNDVEKFNVSSAIQTNQLDRYLLSFTSRFEKSQIDEIIQDNAFSANFVPSDANIYTPLIAETYSDEQIMMIINKMITTISPNSLSWSFYCQLLVTLSKRLNASHRAILIPYLIDQFKNFYHLGNVNSFPAVISYCNIIEVKTLYASLANEINANKILHGTRIPVTSVAYQIIYHFSQHHSVASEDWLAILFEANFRSTLAAGQAYFIPISHAHSYFSLWQHFPKEKRLSELEKVTETLNNSASMNNDNKETVCNTAFEFAMHCKNNDIKIEIINMLKNISFMKTTTNENLLSVFLLPGFSNLSLNDELLLLIEKLSTQGTYLCLLYWKVTLQALIKFAAFASDKNLDSMNIKKLLDLLSDRLTFSNEGYTLHQKGIYPVTIRVLSSQAIAAFAPFYTAKEYLGATTSIIETIKKDCYPVRFAAWKSLCAFATRYPVEKILIANIFSHSEDSFNEWATMQETLCVVVKHFPNPDDFFRKLLIKFSDAEMIPPMIALLEQCSRQKSSLLINEVMTQMKENKDNAIQKTLYMHFFVNIMSSSICSIDQKADIFKTLCIEYKKNGHHQEQLRIIMEKGLPQILNSKINCLELLHELSDKELPEPDPEEMIELLTLSLIIHAYTAIAPAPEAKEDNACTNFASHKRLYSAIS